MLNKDAHAYGGFIAAKKKSGKKKQKDKCAITCEIS